MAERILNVLGSENMTVNCTEDFQFPRGPGGGGSKGIISGKFLLDFYSSVAGQILKRFIPTQTEVPAAISTITATDLVLKAVKAMTQIGEVTNNTHRIRTHT